MTTSSRELTNLALKFRRLGASVLMSQEEGAGHPLPVGAKKRKQPPPGSATQPPATQRHRGVGIDWERFLDQPTELVFYQLRFMLRPRFLPAYEWKQVPVDPDDPDALMEERWVRTHPQHRRKHMVDEIRNLAEAYGFLLRQSRFHALLTDSHLRVQLYKDWLRQPPPSLWLDAKNLPPSHGVGHTNDEIKDVLSLSIPELDHRIEIPQWYSTYLANTFFFEYYCNYQWFLWKRVYAVEQTTAHADSRRNKGKYLWDGEWVTHQRAVRSYLWPGMSQIEDLGPMSVSIMICNYDKPYHIAPMISVTGLGGDEVMADYDNYLENIPKPWLTQQRVSDPNNLRQLGLASLTAVSVLRIPSLSLPNDIYPGYHRGFGLSIRYRTQGKIRPVLLWEKPVFAIAKAAQPPETKYIFWPKLNECKIGGVLMGNSQHAMQMVSLMQAQHPDIYIYIYATAEIRAQPGSVLDLIAGGNTVPTLPLSLDRREWNAEVVRRFAPNKIRTIKDPKDLPDYMKPYELRGPWNRITWTPRTVPIRVRRIPASDEDEDEDEVDRRILEEEGGDETLGGFIVPNSPSDESDDDDDEYSSQAVFKNSVVY